MDSELNQSPQPNSSLRCRAAYPTNGTLRDFLPAHNCSSGLLVPVAPRFNTWVSIIVMLTHIFVPNNSCTVRMSEPLSNKCVANEWRNVWALAFSFTPLRRTVW